MGDATRLQKTFSSSVAAFIVVILPIYFIFVRYGHVEGNTYYAHVNQYYNWFLAIEFMVFVGFGFLMTFLRRYSYGAVGLTYFISALVMVEAILVVGMFQQVVWGDKTKVFVELPLLIDATICAASAMIFFGAVIGKTTPSQLMWLSVMFVPLYAVNQHLVFKTLGALDVGGSISVHQFGAFFGLAASLVISRRQKSPGADNPANGTTYLNNVLAMVGTLFLFIYWPSFNGALASVAVQSGGPDLLTDPAVHAGLFYVIINTVTALLGAVLSTFAMSALVGGRFNMVHVQNATLAGGVIMGSSANLYMTPGGALTIGLAAGAISTLGFEYLSPALERSIGLTDTCGVHNLHGIPGWVGGIVAGFAAFGQKDALLQHGNSQLGYQILAVLVTFGISSLGGLLGGLLVTLPNPWPLTSSSDLYADDRFWLEAQEEEDSQHASHLKTVDPSFSARYGSGYYGATAGKNGNLDSAASQGGHGGAASPVGSHPVQGRRGEGAEEELYRDSSYHGSYAYEEAVNQQQQQEGGQEGAQVELQQQQRGDAGVANAV